MKKLILKNVSGKDASGKDLSLSYKELLSDCVNKPPEGGFGDLLEMELLLKILGKIDSSTEELILEDAEMLKLQECVEKMRWSVLLKDVVTFKKEVKDAPEFVLEG